MRNKINKTGVLAIFLSVLLVAGVVAGCSTGQTSLEENQVAGSLLIRVNPEIKVSYDKDGQMTKVEGNNSEGQQIVDQMGDFTGKPVKEIVNELVTLIYNAGYLVEEIDGDKRSIIFEIESGSRLPSEDFIEQIKNDVEFLLTSMNSKSDIRVMDTSDYGSSDYSDYSDTSNDTNSSGNDGDSGYSDYSNYSETSDYTDDSDDSDYSDYDDSDYDDRSTKATTMQPTTQSAAASQNQSESSDYSDYDDSDYDDSDYDDSDYDESDYDDSDYDDSDYDDSDYDDSDYDDDDSDYSNYSDYD